MPASLHAPARVSPNPTWNRAAQPGEPGGGSPGTENGGGSGGNTGGTGGSTAGTGGSTSGTGGSAGGGTLEPFECPGDPPTVGLITNFDEVDPTDGAWGDSMTGLAGGTFDYGSVTYSYADGALQVAGNVTGYSGAGLFFNTCTDASAYQGIRFSISGNAGEMPMTFQLQTNPDYPIGIVDTDGMKGACQHDPDNPDDNFSVCASPAKTFEVPTSGTVDIIFSELTGGKPDPMADPAQVLGLQWQFAWSDGATPYDVDVTIDDVEFIPIVVD